MEFDKVTIYENLKINANESPSNLAIYYRGKRISYGTLLKLVDKTADIFYHRLGIRKNDVIMVSQPNIPDTIVILYALNKIGAISNLVHPFTPYNQVVSIISKTNTKYAFMFEQRIAKEIDKYVDLSDKIFVTRIENYLPLLQRAFYHIFMNFKIRKKLGKTRSFSGFKYLHNLKQTGNPVDICNDKLNEVSIVLHSGSTTGDPKTILHTDVGFNYLSDNYHSYIGVSKEEMNGIGFLNVLPSFHGFGLEMTMLGPLYNKSYIVMVPKFSAEEVTKILNKIKIHILIGVPTMFEKLFTYEPFSKSRNFRYIQSSYSGGDSLKTVLREKINQTYADNGSIARVYEGYGLTETIAVSTVNTPLCYKDGSLGKPIPDTEIKIVDEKGKELKTNEVGEICFKNKCVMVGYYKDVDATRATIIDGWLHTGDLGYLDEDGFLFFKSRKKRVVKVSGVAVFPTEVEAFITSIPEVEGCIVIEIPDEKFQSSLKAVVKTNFIDEEGLRRKIMDTCQKYLIRWAIPTVIDFRKELPVTKYGKLDFKKVQEEENKARGL